MQFKKA